MKDKIKQLWNSIAYTLDIDSTHPIVLGLAGAGLVAILSLIMTIVF